MRVTVIPADNKIVVDGVALEVTFECDVNIHAIQWYGDHGAIEYKVGGSEHFTDEGALAPYLAAWQAAYDVATAPKPEPEPQPPSVPTTVTMRQARLALLQVGLLDSVNAAVAAADEATKITWEFSSAVERSHPFVATLTAALNLTSQQLDDLFTLAATL